YTLKIQPIIARSLDCFTFQACNNGERKDAWQPVIARVYPKQSNAPTLPQKKREFQGRLSPSGGNAIKF
ncbi:MAG: hypothetical protein LBL79_11005, partial [Prevotella sp.]|nr:hypothetical protein [Prevotella sp.]